MTFAIDPKALAGAHAALKAIPDRKSKIPVTSMFHLAAHGEAITLTATDLDFEASVTVQCKAEFDPVCLPPYLIEAAGSVSAGEVTVKIDDKRAAVSAGRSRYSGAILPGGDFPRLKPEFTTSAEVAGDALAAILEATVDAASRPGADHRYYLEGVLLQTVVEAEAPRLIAVATDGHRLHMTSIAAPAGLELPDGAIIPIKSVNEIARMAKKAAGGSVEIEFGRTMVAVSAGPERLVSKLIAGTFPDWRRVVPAPCEIAATIDIAETVATLDRVMKIQAATEEKKSGAGMKLAENGDFLEISARSQTGDALDGIAAEFVGDWGARGVNGRLLRDTLAAMKDRGAEVATIDAAEPGAPMRVESAADEDFLAIIMPMRI